MLFTDLFDSLLDYLVDNSFLAFEVVILELMTFFNTFSTIIFFKLPGALFLIFLGIIFSNSDSIFYWERFRDNPLLYLKRCEEHILFKIFSRAYINLFLLMFFILAVAKPLEFFVPEDGMHVRAMLTKNNVSQALGVFSLFIILITIMKSHFFAMLGIINKWWDFKIKMLLW